MGRMESPKISSTKNSKYGLANKHLAITRNWAEKKSHDEQSFNRQLFINHTWQLWHFGCRSLLDQLCLHTRNILPSEWSSAEVWLFPSPVFADQFPQAI